MGKEINSDLAFDFAFKGALCEAAREPNQSSSDLCDSAGSYIRAGSAMFFAETEGELTLGSPAAFAAGSVWRGSRAKQSNTPSVSPQKRRRSTSDVTTSRMMEKLSSTTKINRFSVSLIAQIRSDLIWLPGRLTEGAFKGNVKS